MSIVATFRQGIRQHGPRAIPTLVRYYAARVTGLLTGPGRVCPACDAPTREFLPFAELAYGFVRNRAVCPSCGALERHRAYAGFYREFIPANFSRPIDILHASPEDALAPVLTKFARRYDRSHYDSPPPGQLQVDICNPQLPAESYDLIVLNHVLTCVPDDGGGARSLASLLRPGGAILAGEIVLPGVATTTRARPGYGGRCNEYGEAGLAERFAPLDVTLVDVAAHLSTEDRARFGIADRETIVVLRAPQASRAAGAAG